MRRPHGNCYWVQPGRLLAGEYPAAREAPLARRRLAATLDVGVRTFLDLTEDGELPDYRGWLGAEAELRGMDAEHARVAVPDMSVPSTAVMESILDLIDARVAAERAVYLHCHAGVGRTGTVVGCWLVRHGDSGEQALHTLSHLWRTVENSWYLQRSPQTDEQHDYVLGWAERVCSGANTPRR